MHDHSGSVYYPVQCLYNKVCMRLLLKSENFRELEKSATATATSLSESFGEKNNSCARAL